MDKDKTMTTKESKKAVEALTHDEARRKHNWEKVQHEALGH